MTFMMNSLSPSSKKAKKADYEKYHGIFLLSIAGIIFLALFLNNSYLRLRVDSDQVPTLLKWSSHWDKSRRNTSGSIQTYKLSSSLSSRLLIQSTEKNSRLLSQSLAVPDNSFRPFGPLMLAWWVSSCLVLTLQHLLISPIVWIRPVLFNLFFTCVLNHPLHDFIHRIYLRYRLDFLLSDLRRLNARTRTLEELIKKVFFVDDCFLIVHSRHELKPL